MKKLIREMLDDLQQDRSEKDFVPAIPAAPTDGKATYLDPPAEAVVPDDLENQDLSSDQAEEVQQLDFQAQEDEERETLES